MKYIVRHYKENNGNHQEPACLLSMDPLVPHPQKQLSQLYQTTTPSLSFFSSSNHLLQDFRGRSSTTSTTARQTVSAIDRYRHAHTTYVLLVKERFHVIHPSHLRTITDNVATARTGLPGMSEPVLFIAPFVTLSIHMLPTIIKPITTHSTPNGKSLPHPT